MKKFSLVLSVLVLVAAGCKGKEKAAGGAAPGAAPAAGKTFVIGFSQCTFEDPWRINMNRQMEEAAAAHPEVKLIIANGENRNAKQIADVENFIVKGVDALIISPREAAPLTEVVAKAFDRGIPVIVLDRRVLGDKFTVFIGASNIDIGRAAGQYLIDRITAAGGWKLDRKLQLVEIQGIQGATATQERHQGFREVVDKVPWIEVIYDQPGDYKRSPAKSIIDNALQAHPLIDAVYAHNDEMAIGALLAAEAVGRDQGLVIIGIDGQGEAVKLIRDGRIAATFVYKNGANEAIATALQALRGESVPKEFKLETTRITKDEHPEYQGF
jgi:ribose transport system substrate-binding protein